MYLARDVLICGALALGASQIDRLASPLLALVLWPLYWFWQVNHQKLFDAGYVCA
jgi:hypothetical protein